MALARVQGLLILDGCEHLLSATALMTETLLRACPDVAILATSREPLRCAGESLHRLSPLAVAPHRG
jgi:predicted ATPase